jgi:hypothetical protein
MLKKINNFIKKIWNFLTTPYRRIKRELGYKKRLAELKKRDPFIYK